VQWPCTDPACYRFALDIGTRVQRQRTHLKLTQQDLAERVNDMQGPRKGASKNEREGLCSAQYISDLERGRRMPGLRRARALADALGVRLDYLAGRDHHNGARFPSRP
jgi:transcriptional regulator with XRE-family HTH domain